MRGDISLQAGDVIETAMLSLCANSLSAPATAENIDAGPLVMMEAIATWGLEPWDLALTFGQR